MVQGTHARTPEGQRQATLLLGIEGLSVASVTLEDDGGRVVDVVTDEESAAACPECGVLSVSVKERATTRSFTDTESTPHSGQTDSAVPMRSAGQSPTAQ